MEFQPKTKLQNRYEIIQLLGRGGMGAVYLAYDIALEHQIAVKINHNPRPESTAQFIHEAKLLATLRHPNLPRVMDYFLIEQNQFLVMDYIPGDDLAHRLKNKGIQPVDQVMEWAKQLGSALSYLHRQIPPVIHRDIKPANIKLTLAGEVMLVDFGISKSTDNSQATSTGARGYTPGYAPPEQYAGMRTSPLSDQYSFSATLYKLLTNQDPADGIGRALGQEVLAPISQFNPSVAPHIQAAIEKAMSMQPDERFPNVEEFLKALFFPPIYQDPIPQQGDARTIVSSSHSGSNIGTKTPTAGKVLPTSLPSTSSMPGQGVQQPKPSSKTIPFLIAGIVMILLLTLLVSAGGIGFYLWTQQKTAPTPSAVAQISPTDSPKNTETQEPSKTTAVEITPTPQSTPTIKVESTATLTVIIPSNTPEPTTSNTATPEPSATITPSLIGQGGVVAFASNRADGKTFQIWTAKVSMNDQAQLVTSDLMQLTFSEGNKTCLAFSPDGKYLLYTSEGEQSGYDLDIWKLDMTDSNAKPVDLSRRKGDDTDPAWSPDGKTIAFVNNGRDDKLRQIYFMDTEGNTSRRISTNYEEYSPTWSADGKWLLFVVNASSHQTIYTRNASDDFSTPKRFDMSSVFGRMGNVDELSCSPDGSRVAYIEIRRSVSLLFSVRYASYGSDTFQTTKDLQTKEKQPAWSPDSRWLIYTSNRDGNWEIYIITSAGQTQANISNDPGDDMYPVWQP